MLFRSVDRDRARLALVIGGWGTRGKSGTERLKAALLQGLGFENLVKTTGCEAMFIHSLPGVPAIVQGTNGRVAWGFTNLTADLADLIVVERDPANPERYLSAAGPKAIERRTVSLGRGKSRADAEILRTEFGPIVATLAGGQQIGRAHV